MNRYAWVTRSLLLLALGAVLAFAVGYRTGAFNVPVAGLCLIAVGLFDLLLGLSLALYERTAERPPLAPRPRAVLLDEGHPTARLRDGY